MQYSNDPQSSIPKPKLKKAQTAGLIGAMVSKALPELFINANSKSGKGLTKGTLKNKNLALDRVTKRANNQVGAVNRHITKLPPGRSLADAKRLSPVFEKQINTYDSNTKKSELFKKNIRKNTPRTNRGLTRPTEARRALAMKRHITLRSMGEINLDRGDRMSRQADIYEKNQYAKKYNRGVFAGKVIRNMGKLSPVGLVASIMAPKKVGDATIKGNQGEYVKIKGKK